MPSEISLIVFNLFVNFLIKTAFIVLVFGFKLSIYRFSLYFHIHTGLRPYKVFNLKTLSLDRYHRKAFNANLVPFFNYLLLSYGFL